MKPHITQTDCVKPPRLFPTKSWSFVAGLACFCMFYMSLSARTH